MCKKVNIDRKKHRCVHTLQTVPSIQTESKNIYRETKGLNREFDSCIKKCTLDPKGRYTSSSSLLLAFLKAKVCFNQHLFPITYSDIFLRKWCKVQMAG